MRGHEINGFNSTQCNNPLIGTRIADHTQAFGDTGFGRLVSRAVRTRLDLSFWAGWWLLIAAFLYVGIFL